MLNVELVMSYLSTLFFQGKGIFSFFKSKFSKAESSKVSQEGSSDRTRSQETTSREDNHEYAQSQDVFVDPVIAKLKSAKVMCSNWCRIAIRIILNKLFFLQSVKDLYTVAEKIVGSNIENVLDKSKSGDADDPAT